MNGDSFSSLRSEVAGDQAAKVLRAARDEDDFVLMEWSAMRISFQFGRFKSTQDRPENKRLQPGWIIQKNSPILAPVPLMMDCPVNYHLIQLNGL